MKTINLRKIANAGFITAVLLVIGTSCNNDDPWSDFERGSEMTAEDNGVIFKQDFTVGQGGWEAIFAEYPKADKAFYELKSGKSQLPSPLDQNKTAFMLSGNNHSDALQMFVAKQFTGLDPATGYSVKVKVELASKYPDGSVGIGGSPANSVHLVTHICRGGYQLDPGDDKTNVQLKFNKNSENGYDYLELGDIAIPADKNEYQLIQRECVSENIVKADEAGRIWAVVGTWSGFEGITTLYYTNIQIKFTKVQS